MKFAEFVQTRNGKKTLQEILNNAEYGEDELREETIKDINKSRNEYRKGKTYSLEQVKKELGL